jgi:hypothetical protein
VGGKWPQCDDGIDNDGDGRTDYPSDTGCVNLDDNSEVNGVSLSGFTLSGDNVAPIRFVGTSGAESGTVKLSINPINPFSSSVTVSVASIVSKTTGQPLPSGVEASYSFNGGDFSTNPSATMTMNGSGVYINSSGEIGLPVKIKISKKVTDGYIVTFTASGGGTSDTHEVLVDSKSVNPGFEER